MPKPTNTQRHARLRQLVKKLRARGETRTTARLQALIDRETYSPGHVERPEEVSNADD